MESPSVPGSRSRVAKFGYATHTHTPHNAQHTDPHARTTQQRNATQCNTRTKGNRTQHTHARALPAGHQRWRLAFASCRLRRETWCLCWPHEPVRKVRYLIKVPNPREAIEKKGRPLKGMSLWQPPPRARPQNGHFGCRDLKVSIRAGAGAPTSGPLGPHSPANSLHAPG